MPSAGENLNRRTFLKKSLSVSGAGLVAAASFEERALLAHAAGPSPAAPDPPAQGLPLGALGKLKVSRLICGGNLFDGYAHSRNLIYVSRLMREYFTAEKIMDTLELCEQSGVNTVIALCGRHMLDVLGRYRKERGGKIQWLAQALPAVNDMTNVKLAIDNGAAGAFVQGGVGDRLVGDGRLDTVGKFLDLVKENGLVAGVGGHALKVPQDVEAHGLKPDFYFKTVNGVGYSSQPPAEVAAVMKPIARPWIAFKVLGAGAVKPQEGFQSAFALGADFLCVGVFDFQVKEDVKIVTDLLSGGLPRERPWRS